MDRSDIFEVSNYRVQKSFVKVSARAVCEVMRRRRVSRDGRFTFPRSALQGSMETITFSLTIYFHTASRETYRE